MRLGLIAQLVEHCTGITEATVMGSNPVGASEFFLGFICNCIIFILHNCEDHFHLYSLSTVHSYTCMVFIIYTSYMYNIMGS